MITTDVTVGAIIWVPAFFLGRSSVRHFKTRKQADFFDIDDLGGNAPVVYLRPFDEDDDMDGAFAFNLYNPKTWRKFPISPSNMRTLYLEMTLRNSFEQVLAYYVRGVGPLVAFGEPGQPPILGAKNYYMGDVNWKEQVIKFAQQSQMVVATVGTSEGVVWEVGAMVKHLTPERFLLFIPGSSRRQRRIAYRAFHAAAAKSFPNGLPEDVNGRRCLLFDKEWNVTPEKIRRPVRHSPAWIAHRLHQTLK